MASPDLNAADVARLAHQALRLRESGIDSEAAVRQLDAGPRRARGGQSVRPGNPRPLAGVASAVVDRLDADRPGATDPQLVGDLMGRSLDDIWKTWDAAVTENLEQQLDGDDLAEWRASVERDQAAYEERVALMTGSSDEELLERMEAMLADSDLSEEEQDRMRARLATEPGGPHEWNVHPYFGHERHTEGAANAFYDLGREGFADGDIRLITATIKVVLVDSADYAVNLASHQFLSSVAAIGRVATSPALANKTRAAGVFDADDTTLATVSGDPSEALILVQSSAAAGGADVADTAQRLIGYIDTATGLPVTPNGGNINVVWDSGSNRIFKL